MENRSLDKINMAYKGELGERMKLASQGRIDWMCSHSKGEKILDVGCSQGIVSILLAKKGKFVTGIDIEPEQIEYAKRELTDENTDIQSRVDFVCGDFVEFDFCNEKYDTIIVGECLEHVFNPAIFLRKAKSLLKDNGILIVTVPFGINPHPDHKRTYYFLELFNQINETVPVDSFKFFGQWIGFIADKSLDKTRVDVDSDLLGLVENAFFKVDTISHDIIKRQKEQLEQINKEKEQLVRIKKANEQEVEVLQHKFEEMNRSAYQAKHEIKQLKEKFEEMNDVAYSYKKKTRVLNEKNKEFEKSLVAYKSAYENLFKLRGIKAWLKIRRLLGKPYHIESGEISASSYTKETNTEETKEKSKLIKSEEKVNVYNKLGLHKKFYNDLESITSIIGDSNGSSYYEKSSIHVGIMTDEFMFNYYKDALDLTYISPDNYKKVIDEDNIDFLMFISCWHGMNGREDYSGDHKRKTVIDIMKYAKNNDIPVVFQTIEDPTNYNIFIEIAKNADYIFTSDSNMIEKYKLETRNENVFYLGYGINPQFHNPIGSFVKHRHENKRNNVFFAGSWTDRYPNRCKDIEMIFDAVINSKKYDLIIADRNMNLDGYAYPDKYAKFIIPPIKHELLQKVHKLFDYTININTITDSPTMCAMRVYEVQALGSLLLSNNSLASSNTFPGIFNIVMPEEVDNVLNKYGEKDIKFMQLQGIRDVLSNYTVYDRLNYIFEKIGLDYEYVNKTVYVLYEELTENIKKSFDIQSYKEKKLLSISDYLKTDKKGGYFIIINDKIYDENFILDLINATKYTDTEYIKYCDYLNSEEAFEYVDNNNSYEETLYDAAKVDFLDVVEKVGKLEKGFSIPYLRFNDESSQVEKEVAVIIPVYNNGRYLRDRAIRSLRRSSIFDSMQLYIIDDGSTEEETISIIHELENMYDNITTFFFNDGGSGSASRPRNKGVEISTEKYITYLDPDNEAINDGYALLLEDVENKDVDFAFGGIIKVDDSISTLFFEYEDDLIETPRDKLLEKTFKTNSIQACLVKRELIEKNHIKNPVGAIGQDTMFFYELLLNCRRAYHRYTPIHIYYAQRNNSVVNAIGKSFFKKSYIMEEYQCKALKKYNLMKEYKKIKFDQFFNDWYVKKLEYVNEAEREECNTILDKIRKLYY